MEVPRGSEWLLGLWQLQFNRTGEQFTWTGQPVPVHRNWTGTPVPVPRSWTVWPVHQKKNWWKLDLETHFDFNLNQFFFWWTGQTVQLPGTGTGVPVQFLWTGTGWPVHVNCSPVFLNWSCHSPTPEVSLIPSWVKVIGCVHSLYELSRSKGHRMRSFSIWTV